MPIHTERGFRPMGDRYEFDFKLCTPSKGWAQVDTRQDASYHGIWINPITREYASYVEGDTTHIRCDTDEEFCTMLRETIAWHKERDYFIGIDGMCSPPIIEALKRLGFAEFMH